MSVEGSQPSGSLAGSARRPKTFATAAAIGAVVVLSGVVLWSQGGNDSPAEVHAGNASAPVVTADNVGIAVLPHEVTQPTVFIVTNADEATVMQLNIEEADRIRAASGLGPYGDTVVLVSSEVEGSTVELAMAEANLIRVANGLPEQRVVRVTEETALTGTTAASGR